MLNESTDKLNEEPTEDSKIADDDDTTIRTVSLSSEKTDEGFKIKEGNSFLFLVFTSLNFMLFLSSIGMLGCDIYLFAKTGEANVITIFLLVTSLTLMMLSFCSFKLRRSIHFLACYLILMTTCFTITFICTLILFFSHGMVKGWIRKVFESLEIKD